ncbi:MAG: MXAN_5187 C-terminal domain-containing protein, partial [Myxococcota bacterium]
SKGRPPPVPAGARGGTLPKPPRKSRSALDEARMRKIYESYVAARRRNNEPVENLKFETMQRRLQRMVPKLQEKHGTRTIDFKVVLKDGKVGLKPVASE